MLLPHNFLLDLTVIKVAQLDTLVMLALPTVLILDPVFDHVVQRENVPCVVGLGLDLTLYFVSNFISNDLKSGHYCITL